jgi:hypothetical protein
LATESQPPPPKERKKKEKEKGGVIPLIGVTPSHYLSVHRYPSGYVGKV